MHRLTKSSRAEIFLVSNSGPGEWLMKMAQDVAQKEKNRAYEQKGCPIDKKA